MRQVHQWSPLTSQLGRGTAPQEGVGLSHAIAESLIQRKVSDDVCEYHRRQAFVLFATHFRDLAQTLNTQNGIVKWVQISENALMFSLHLKTEVGKGETQELTFRRRAPSRIRQNLVPASCTRSWTDHVKSSIMASLTTSRFADIQVSSSQNWRRCLNM